MGKVIDGLVQGKVPVRSRFPRKFIVWWLHGVESSNFMPGLWLCKLCQIEKAQLPYLQAPPGKGRYPLTILLDKDADVTLYASKPEWATAQMVEECVTPRLYPSIIEIIRVYSSVAAAVASLYELGGFGPVEVDDTGKYLLLGSPPSADLVNRYLWQRLMGGET